jgi:hypothetical protein
MKKILIVIIAVSFLWQFGFAQEKLESVRGDPQAIGDPHYEIRFGKGDIRGSRRLELYGPDGIMHGWIILNARKEPLVWATTQYRYTFGPMKRFGNLRVPNWAVYENGGTMYEMISLEGSNQPPDPSLFQPHPEYREKE